MAPLASLLVRSGALKGRRLPIKVPVVNIGRADFNDVVIADPSVSTSHAKLQRRDDVWILTDLGSTNGTFVEGERLSGEVALGPGTTVKFGEVAVLFEPFDESVPIRRSSGTQVLSAILPSAARRTRRHRGHRARRRRPDAPHPAPDPASTPRPSGPPAWLITVARARRRGGGGLLHPALTERDPVHFTCAARTDVGIVRSGNEDNYLMLAEHGVFIVADGMGGHAAGEVASEMAVRITSHQIGSLRGLTDEQAGERVSAAIRAANDAIFERTLTEHDKRGMGTTATVLVLMPRRYLIGQVGDSRAYLLRRGEFQQLTKDHSYVQEQVDAGPAHAGAGAGASVQQRDHPLRRRRAWTWCPTSTSGRWRQGDVLLLASDGLTGMLEDEQLTRILSADGGPQHWVDRMVTEANRRGGLDNITAIVIRIDSVDSTTGEHPTAAAAAQAELVRSPGKSPAPA